MFDLFFTFPGVFLLLPLMALIAIWVKLDSRGPIIYKQIRLGQYERPFYMYKFRTMIVDAEKKGLKITRGNDSRITRIGNFLRKYKLDELPQLFNVLRGEMSLVGPRPEVPEYIDTYTDSERGIVLSVRPGLTDYASIEFRNENELLSGSEDVHNDYINKILPIKKRYYIQYVEERSLWVDFKLILKTLRLIIG